MCYVFRVCAQQIIFYYGFCVLFAITNTGMDAVRVLEFYRNGDIKSRINSNVRPIPILCTRTVNDNNIINDSI